MSRALDADVIVIGAGISGLACAWNLQQRGLRIIVLESQSRAGGSIGSAREQGYLVEAGPNSALDTTPLIARLLKETGIAGERIAASRSAANRYILRNGKLIALPMSPAEFIGSRLFSLRAKLRLLKEPFIGAPSAAEETVAGFVRRRLGSEFLDYAINPFVAGVYAGEPEALSVQAAFPRLYELEQAHGSLIRGYLAGSAARKRNPEKSKHVAPMFAFRDGMQTLTDAIARKLARVELVTAAVKVVPGPACQSVTVRSPQGLRDFRARAVVIATPAHAAAGLIAGFSPAAGAALATIPYPPVAVAVCGYLRDTIAHPLDGFGVLVPQCEHGQTLGTLFSSSVFGHRAPSGKVVLTTFVGGMRQPSIARLAGAEIAAIVQAGHAAMLGARSAPDFVRIKRWEQAIPQYTLGHHDRMSVVDSAEREFPGVFFCANYRGGVAIGDCVKAAYGMAGKAESFLRGG